MVWIDEEVTLFLRRILFATLCRSVLHQVRALEAIAEEECRKPAKGLTPLDHAGASPLAVGILTPQEVTCVCAFENDRVDS